MATSQQIPVAFSPTYGAPLDARTELDRLANLSNIDKAVRYPGLEIWVKDQHKWYFFNDGIEDSDFVPSEDRMIICRNLEDFNTIYSKERSKKIGQIVYLEFPGTYYKYTASGLKPLFDDGIIHISTYTQSALNTEYYLNDGIVSKPIGRILFFEDQQAFYFDPIGASNYGDTVQLSRLVPMGTIEADSLTKPERYGRPGTIYIIGASKEPYIIAFQNRPVRAFVKRVKVSNSLVLGNNILEHNLNTKHIIVEAFTKNGQKITVPWDFIDSNKIVVDIQVLPEPIECFVYDSPALEM